MVSDYNPTHNSTHAAKTINNGLYILSLLIPNLFNKPNDLFRNWDGSVIYATSTDKKKWSIQLVLSVSWNKKHYLYMAFISYHYSEGVLLPYDCFWEVAFPTNMLYDPFDSNGVFCRQWGVCFDLLQSYSLQAFSWLHIQSSFELHIFRNGAFKATI